MFGFLLQLNGMIITESNFEYESAEEAESEGNFAASSYADSMNIHWSCFDVAVIKEY